MPVTIHPTALVEKGAELGANVAVGAFCIIGKHVRIGDNTRLHSSVLVVGHTTLGKNNEVYSFTSLGNPPQHINYKGEKSTLTIGDNNIIREFVSIHRGSPFGGLETKVGSHNMIMATCHIGHDCAIGSHVIMATNTIVGGHVHIGDYVYLGGGVAIQQFVRIGHSTIIGGKSAVVNDVIPFALAVGNRCRLDGINIIGLRRRGFGKARINAIYEAWKLIFKNEGSGNFQQRLAEAEVGYADNKDVMEMIQFIKAKNKVAIMQAHAGAGNDAGGV